MPNMRDFLNRIKKQGADREVSLVNTPSSFLWEFKGKEYGKNFLDNELIYYVQSMTIPDIAVDSGESAGSELQHSTVPTMRMAASQTVQMEILETRKPIIEEYFVPWMLEAREPKFHEDMAYTYANVTIKFNEKKLQYKLFGCRPTACETINPSQRDTTLVRKVTLNIDFILGLPSGSFTPSMGSSSESTPSTPVESMIDAPATPMTPTETPVNYGTPTETVDAPIDYSTFGTSVPTAIA